MWWKFIVLKNKTTILVLFWWVLVFVVVISRIRVWPWWCQSHRLSAICPCACLEDDVKRIGKFMYLESQVSMTVQVETPATSYLDFALGFILGIHWIVCNQFLCFYTLYWYMTISSQWQTVIICGASSSDYIFCLNFRYWTPRILTVCCPHQPEMVLYQYVL